MSDICGASITLMCHTQSSSIHNNVSKDTMTGIVINHKAQNASWALMTIPMQNSSTLEEFHTWCTALVLPVVIKECRFLRKGVLIVSGSLPSVDGQACSQIHYYIDDCVYILPFSLTVIINERNSKLEGIWFFNEVSGN